MTGASKRSKSGRVQQYPRWVPYLFIAPFFIGFLIFSLTPIVYSFYISLTEWTGFHDPVFIGFQNFSTLLRDELFYKSITNTITIFTIFIPCMIVPGLIVAFLLYTRFIKGSNFFQTIFFLPYITTPVAVGMLFKAMFNGEYGFVNKLLLQLGVLSEPIQWLNIPSYTAPLIALVVVWQSVGYCTIMFMAGLKGISREVFESAMVDGASGFKIFTRIAMPLVKPVAAFLIITTMIWGFQLFDETFLLYGRVGGAEYSGLTLVSYLYVTAFIDGRYGYGAALGYALSILIIGSTLLMRRLLLEKEA